MIGTSDRLCWLAETCKILLLLLLLQCCTAASLTSCAFFSNSGSSERSSMQPGLQARLNVTTAFAALPFTAAMTVFVAAAAAVFQLHTMQMTATDLQLAVYNLNSGLPCRLCNQQICKSHLLCFPGSSSFVQQHRMKQEVMACNSMQQGSMS